MAYMRDQDYRTRGVRAIASADNSPSRQARRVDMAQATRARDRAMARIARGALGDPLTPWLTPGATYTAFTTNVDITPKPTPTFSVSTGPHPQPTDPGHIGPPPHPQPAPPVSPPSSSPSSGGGAGGSGVAMGPAPVSAPIPPIPVLDTGEPAQTIPPPDNTMRNVLIAAGAAVGAYFLFIRGRSP
jgi:hypothetical protein